jgi:AcrR family transcriptional regulator
MGTTRSGGGAGESSQVDGTNRGPLAAPGPEADGGGGAPAAKRALRNQGRRTMRKLLDAAMVAFDRRGYHATRVNDVVEIAKTSHGTFYLYFSNKEDLLRALVAEAAADVETLNQNLAAPEGEPTWEDTRAWIGEYAVLWGRYAPLLRVWTDLATVDAELGTQVRTTLGSLSRALADRVAAVPHDEPIDPEVAGLAMLAMLDRFYFLQEFMGRSSDDDALDTLTTIVHRAVLTAAPAPTARR